MSKIRAGDHVRHEPTDEDWIVAYADEENDRLAWCGWPDGTAKLSDCKLLNQCDDDEHALVLESLLDVGGARASRAKCALEELGFTVRGVEVSK